MAKIALCAGSFDPPTNGHLNIIERGTRLFDKVVVAVAVNSGKKTTFTAQERVEMLKEIFKGRTDIEIDTFEDRLLVDYARSKKAVVLLRGLRNITDYEYELQMALANKKLAAEIDTIFMMTESQYSHLSSSLLKEIVFLGGSVDEMIHPLVEKKLKKKLKP
ncbi:MAG: pantetheine-phosphate adenylyltransferase [Deltaproteobacteria bacterium]|nr:pantetheine-phosphate adenylyltransferase [Deltaproteobacteria bacterium]